MFSLRVKNYFMPFMVGSCLRFFYYAFVSENDINVLKSLSIGKTDVFENLEFVFTRGGAKLVYYHDFGPWPQYSQICFEKLLKHIKFFNLTIKYQRIFAEGLHSFRGRSWCLLGRSPVGSLNLSVHCSVTVSMAH